MCSSVEVVDDVERQHAVVRAAEVGAEHVAGLVLDPVAQPVLGDDLAARRGARLQVQHRRVERRVLAAQLGGVPAVAAGDVEQRLRLRRKAQLLRDLAGRQTRQLELPRM